MKNQNELETLLKKNLEALKDIPARDPRIATQRRAQFLSRAVSASEVHRHKKWMFTFRKENFAMNLIISTLVIAGLLFGGGATVRAAQDDLPNEPLYAVKMWSEETRLQFQNNPQDKVDYLMTMAQTRIVEMAQLVADGEPIPEETPILLQQHIQQALQLCTNTEDATCDQTMLQIRDRLREQDHLMQQLLIDAPEDAQPTLLRTREMLRTHLQQVEDGLLLGDMNQNMIQNQNMNGQSDEFTLPTQTETGTQFNQPTEAPSGPNESPGRPGNSGSDPGGGNPNQGNGNQP
ncbi:MAG TPA: hypothetical protein DCY14_16435 [Anaerolineae bacterium]|nr:hypothetical protein [Anaerolineae bacterium]HRJ56095.1 DUF5667 domain-containing protein [Anaerolineales bacterium]